MQLDEFGFLYWRNNVTSDLSPRNLNKNIRHNQKILIDAQDKTYEYSMKKNRLGWTFEGMLRSVGLVAGTLVAGPTGAVTMGAIGSGIGRSIGTHMGNKIYGQAMQDLDTISEDYKYRQMANQYAVEMAKGTNNMINELYNQTYDTESTIASELASEQ